MKGAEFHRNIFLRKPYVVEGGECYLVRGVSSCYFILSETAKAGYSRRTRCLRWLTSFILVAQKTTL